MECGQAPNFDVGKVRNLRKVGGLSEAGMYGMWPLSIPAGIRRLGRRMLLFKNMENPTANSFPLNFLFYERIEVTKELAMMLIMLMNF
jgi:hypothetical protein